MSALSHGIFATKQCQCIFLYTGTTTVNMESYLSFCNIVHNELKISSLNFNINFAPRAQTSLEVLETVFSERCLIKYEKHFW